MDIGSEGCENVKELASRGKEIPLDALDKYTEKVNASFRTLCLEIISDVSQHEEYLKIIEPFVGTPGNIELWLHGDVPENALRKLNECGALAREKGIPRYAS